MAKLPRLQIHLSTAVLMMLAAGTMIWANTAARPIDFFVEKEVNLESELDKKRYKSALYKYLVMMAEAELEREGSYSETSREEKMVRRGWPCSMLKTISIAAVGKKNSRSVVDSWTIFYGYRTVAMNAFVGLAIVLGVGCVSEMLIRRRDSKLENLKPENQEVK